MTNPKIAIDTILTDTKTINGITVHPITLARYALLELVDSPLVNREQQFKISNLIPSFYICCASTDELKGITSKNIDALQEKAFLWAESLPEDCVSPLLTNILEELGLINKAAPTGKDESPKKVQDNLEMDGSQV